MNPKVRPRHATGLLWGFVVHCEECGQVSPRTYAWPLPLFLACRRHARLHRTDQQRMAT